MNAWLTGIIRVAKSIGMNEFSPPILQAQIPLPAAIEIKFICYNPTAPL